MTAPSEQIMGEPLQFLQVTNLRKAFLMGGTELTVVDVQHFNLFTGDQIAIFGKSGTGKSTFLNLLAGTLKPDSGSIIIKETDLTVLSESERDRLRSRNLGYVFQSFHLLQGCTALENILVAMAVAGVANEERAKELLSLVGLSEKESSLPSQLSIGQQQRVCIARALANKPKLILADEPTGSLDPENATRSIKLLQSLCDQNGCALIVVSHDPNIINCFENSIKWEDLNKVGESFNES
jgi:putative ABC transport system ATP-binding protein